MLKKVLIGFFYAIFVSSLLAAGTISDFVKAVNQGIQATYVGGVIWENTIWTLENSPYILDDDVIIASNATLTIEPGVVINLDLWSLIIEGTLYARGNENSRIKFQSKERPLRAWPPRIYFADTSTCWNETTGVGCIIEYAEIDIVNYQYETILGGMPKISKNVIFNYGNDAGAVRTNGIISNNTIAGGYRGITAESSSILYNVIKEAYCGISASGIMPGSTHYPVIFGNLIIDNYEGIRFSGPSSPYISNNTIVRNMYGFCFDSNAFYQDTMPLGIIYNNIQNNVDVLVEKEDPRITINMTLNWWGTTNVSMIDEKIHDQKDNRRLSLVNYIPFLTSPAEFPLDKTPPITMDDYDCLWRNADFTITLTAMDYESGVAETYYRINNCSIKAVSVDGQPLISTEGANNTLEYWSIDNAGNEELPHKTLIEIKLDKTAPSSSIRFDGVTSENDWFVSNVTATLTANDELSGIDLILYSFDNVTWETYATPFNINNEGHIIVYFKSVDKAGNIEPVNVERIKIDKTPPIADAGQNQTVTVGEIINFNAGASIDNIGIVNFEWDFGDGTAAMGVVVSHAYTNPGNYTVTLMVKDIAGNTAMHSIAVTVLQPQSFPTWVLVTGTTVTIGIGVIVAILLKRRK